MDRSGKSDGATDGQRRAEKSERDPTGYVKSVSRRKDTPRRVFKFITLRG